LKLLLAKKEIFGILEQLVTTFSFSTSSAICFFSKKERFHTKTFHTLISDDNIIAVLLSTIT